MILFMYVCVIVLFVILSLIDIIQIRRLKRENNYIRNYMQSMDELYNEIRNRIEAVRRYRHDLAKHIQTLENLIKNREEGFAKQNIPDNMRGGVWAIL